MNRLKTILSVIAISAFLALLVPAWFFISKNRISRINHLKEKAKREFFAREFVSAYKTYETLFDSLEIDDDRALMNYANATFMSSNILKKGFYGRPGVDQPALPDSMLEQLARKSQDMYTILTTTPEKSISSMAYNQLGYSAVKGNGSFDSGGSVDTVLLSALEYFKLALKQNPNNDSARYNYELIRKVIGYPEEVLAETRALVAERRYVDAARLLEHGMQRDIRLTKQREYLERIKAVAAIDTTFRGRRL